VLRLFTVTTYSKKITGLLMPGSRSARRAAAIEAHYGCVKVLSETGFYDVYPCLLTDSANEAICAASGPSGARDRTTWLLTMHFMVDSFPDSAG
jgi:hypothetical protein